jgi:hypothetical protein
MSIRLCRISSCLSIHKHKMCHAQSECVVNVPPLLISVASWQGMQGGDLKLLGGLKCVLMGVAGVQASELIPQTLQAWQRSSGGDSHPKNAEHKSSFSVALCL